MLRETIGRYGATAAALMTLAGLTATAAATPPTTTKPAVGADSGTFTVLTYNIAGLPLGLGDSDPGTNTPLIGQRLGAYDIVNVQEDFNYHAAPTGTASGAMKPSSDIVTLKNTFPAISPPFPSVWSRSGRFRSR